jgi:hypothetical protein
MYIYVHVYEYSTLKLVHCSVQQKCKMSFSTDSCPFILLHPGKKSTETVKDKYCKMKTEVYRNWYQKILFDKTVLSARVLFRPQMDTITREAKTFSAFFVRLTLAQPVG